MLIIYTTWYNSQCIQIAKNCSEYRRGDSRQQFRIVFPWGTGSWFPYNIQGSLDTVWRWDDGCPKSVRAATADQGSQTVYVTSKVQILYRSVHHICDTYTLRCVTFKLSIRNQIRPKRYTLNESYTILNFWNFSF